jgi:hypothetical protein
MSVADEVSGTASAVYWTNKGAQALYRKAQHVGMRFQNWRHKGAGEQDGSALETAPNSARMDGQTLTPRNGKRQWTSDEESFSNTTTSHTTYTRKRTR